MDKGFGGESSTNSNNNGGGGGGGNIEMYLKQLNNNSHKIMKPFRKPIHATAVSASAASVSNSAAAALLIPETNTPPQSQQQPPVYNINKNDFRDVVQKLTGSPSHERFPTPPSLVTQSRQSSSRLQRIRPPPLSQISNRPPQLSQVVPCPPNDVSQRAALQSLTPLPPFPSVHPAAESPVSSYMRFLQGSAVSSSPSPLWNGEASIGPCPESLMPQNEVCQRAPPSQPSSQLPPTNSSISTCLRFLQNSADYSAVPPWNGVSLPPPSYPPLLPPQQLQPPLPSSSAWASPFPVLPLSPLPFGCIPSPRSPYGMHSPGLLYPSTGQFGLPQLPLSPTVPLPSPKWRTV